MLISNGKWKANLRTDVSPDSEETERLNRSGLKAELSERGVNSRQWKIVLNMFHVKLR